MAKMWIIEPRDPLIVRDGRPFGATPGARAKTLPFPFPSTIAGGVRTRAGQDENGRFDPKNIEKVMQISIRGPLLTQIKEDDNLAWLVPAPRDALLFDPEGSKGYTENVDVLPLIPIQHDEMNTDLPKPLVYPVGLETINLRKPAKAVPAFWHWECFAKWLVNHTATTLSREDVGVASFPENTRSHVAIDGDSLTGEEGALFATSGLEFRLPTDRLNDSEQFGLAVEVEMVPELKIEAGMAPLGGERRLMHWFSVKEGLPDPPEGLVKKIVADKACRLVLLTPAYFEAGWLPKRLLQEREGLVPELIAAAVGTPATVSGWDYAHNVAKPTRRLVPAGSVYFIKLNGALDLDKIESWVNQMWLKTMSDDEESRLAGFGLTAVGCWDGQVKTIRLPKGGQQCVNQKSS